MWVYVTPNTPVMEIQYLILCETSFVSELLKEPLAKFLK
jgi:hypothetical protein